MPMHHNKEVADDFEGSIAANGRPFVMLDGGPTYDELAIETNLAASEFGLLVEVDGDKRVEITGARLLTRESFDGKTATSGFFVFSFIDVMARLRETQNMTALVTAPGQRIKVTLVIGGSVAASTPAASLYVKTSPNRPEEFRLYDLPEQIPVTKIGENSFNGLRTGDVPYASKESGEKIQIVRADIFGAVSHLEIRQGSRSVFGRGGLPVEVNNAELTANGKSVISGCYTLHPAMYGNPYTDGLDTFNKEHPRLRLLVTTTDANDCEAQVSYVYDLRNR